MIRAATKGDLVPPTRRCLVYAVKTPVHAGGSGDFEEGDLVLDVSFLLVADIDLLAG